MLYSSRRRNIERDSDVLLKAVHASTSGNNTNLSEVLKALES